MKQIIAPQAYDKSDRCLFLAGSIEMGSAELWQEYVIDQLRDCDGTILNPRRDVWDESWEQSIDNEQFYKQVLWEINGQKDADHILMHFDAKTKAPITLMELGLFAESGKLIVSCPEGFWRQGNVVVVCREYDIPCFKKLDDAVNDLRKKLLKNYI